MKKNILVIMAALMLIASCTKQIWNDPRCSLIVNNEQVNVGTTTARIQCDYTIKRNGPFNGHSTPYVVYGESESEMHDTIMESLGIIDGQDLETYTRIHVSLNGLKENTTYYYYYLFKNGYDSIWSETKTFKTENDSAVVTTPTVITLDVTEITSNSAIGSGQVTENGGAEVIERGICWSTNVDPTLNDSYITSGTGTGAFIAMMDSLEANTTYHVRAYASNEKGTAYGLDREFTTLSSGGGSGDNDYVDLGLPSGTLWATCNVGANVPEEYGDYFAWAEIETKTYYFWEGYRYGHTQGSGHTFVLRFTKYCNNTIYGYIGFTDTLTVLQSMDDAAIANWGSDWRMPTWEEMEELVENTTHAWTTQNGVFGSLFTATNGNSLFLPAAGRYIRSDLKDAGVSCCYHSSSLWDEPYSAKGLWLNYNTDDYHSNDRTYGCQVRAVRSTK